MSRKDISDVLVLRAYVAGEEHYKNNHIVKWPQNILVEWTGQPEKVCIAAMWRAFDRELIEYGISLRSGWLTPKGVKLLADNGEQTPTR